MSKRFTFVGIGLIIAVFMAVFLFARKEPPKSGDGDRGKTNARNGRIAFVSNARDGNEEIYTINPDGAGLTRLTQNTALDDDPAWSPDGKKIAFMSARDGNQEIYVMDADGSNVVRLTENGSTNHFQPDWSPDGTQIVFGVFDGTKSPRGFPFTHIFTMNADGANIRQLTSGSFRDIEPHFSHDGTKILFARFTPPDMGQPSQNIYVMDTSGGHLQQLTHDVGHGSGDASWSPDDKRISFGTDRDCGTSCPPGFAKIYVMNADGSNQTNISDNASTMFDGDTAWSPDGAKIAYEGMRDNGKGIDEIFTMNADGRSQTQLTKSMTRAYNPDWQPAR